MDIFERKGIKPMLIAEMQDPFNSPDHIYEIKLDGIRCVAYIDRYGVDFRNKRDKRLLSHVPELTDIYRQVRQRCILDGELFIMWNGVTDFFKIQRRVTLNDPFKIQLDSKRHPAAFVAYDCIYLDDREIIDYSLMERKNILSGLITESSSFGVSRYIEENGIQLYEATKQQKLEGIVAKHKESKYFYDKKTKDWIKCKHMQTDDCVVCGYIRKDNHMTSLVLGQYDHDQLVYKGHVTFGVGLKSILDQQPREILASPFGYVPEGNMNAVWFKPELVCIVESMPSDLGGLRQPVFRGFRDDKEARDCVVRDGEN